MTPHCEHVTATGIYLTELLGCIYPGFVLKSRVRAFRMAEVNLGIICGKKEEGYPTEELTICLTHSNIKPNVSFHLSSVSRELNRFSFMS